MSALRNSPYGKRLRASRHDEVDEDHDEPRRGRQRVNPIFGLGSLMPLSLPSEDDVSSAAWSSSSSSSSTMPSRPTSTTPPLEASSGSGSGTSNSSGPDSPGDAATKEKEKDYGDRFVPSRQGDLRTTYYLLEQAGPSTPSKKNRIIPSESDALKGMAWLAHP
jgi:cell division cycle 20-like protein 1, cofactor of APC complex